MPDQSPEPRDGRTRGEPTPGFAWLWSEFTSVRREDPGAVW
jgi:hypothetical protein